MKENTIKAILTAAITAFAAYFRLLLVPLVILTAAVIVDYATGMAKAYSTSELNSRVGYHGIIKKLSYYIVVAVGMGVDWMLQSGLAEVGIDYDINFTVALLIIIWLIINEMISILENLAVIGVPLPAFLVALIKRLKNTIDEKGEQKNDNI